MKSTWYGHCWRLSGDDSACWCRRHGLDPRSGKVTRWGAAKPRHNRWACALEPGSRDCWAPVLLSRSQATAATEARVSQSPCSAPRSRRHERPTPRRLESRPCSPRLEKACVQQEDCTQPKTNKPVQKITTGFPGSSVGKESVCSAGDPGSIPGLGRFPGEGIGYPLQYSWVCPVAQLVKNPPAVRETQVWSLGSEDPLDKGKGYPLQYSGLENSMDCISVGSQK